MQGINFEGIRLSQKDMAFIRMFVAAFAPQIKQSGTKESFLDRFGRRVEVLEDLIDQVFIPAESEQELIDRMGANFLLISVLSASIVREMQIQVDFPSLIKTLEEFEA